MIKYILEFIIIGLLSLFLTYLIKLYALKYKILDIPNNRSSHFSPTPRGGGLAIVICWYIGITFLYFTHEIESKLYFAFLSGIILAIISLVDDIISLKPAFRLLAQFISAIIALFFLKGLCSLKIGSLIIDSELILLPFIIIAIVWFINLFNFLDGIDGYASVEAISIAVVLFLFTRNLVSIILVACVAGFLYWNWPKAKIFMGDIGSTQLGFILIILGIYLNNENQFDFVFWAILASPFWFDATLTLFRRIINKEELSQAHRKHAYQRIVQSGFSHKKTDLILIIINIILALVIFVIHRYAILSIPLIIAVLGFLVLINYMVDKRMPFNN